MSIGLITALSVISFGLYKSRVSLAKPSHIILLCIFFVLPTLYAVAILYKNLGIARIVFKIWVVIVFMTCVVFLPRNNSEWRHYIIFLSIAFLHIVGLWIGLQGLPRSATAESMLLKKSDLKPKVLVFVGLITAILTIYAEGYFNNGYGMLITMISLGLYVFALIRQSLVLSKSAYFMWIIFVFIRFVAYIFQYGQPFANINKMVGVIITAVLLWLGIRGLIMFETSLVRYQKKTLITDESSNDSTG